MTYWMTARVLSASAARDGGDDADFVAGLERRRQPGEEAHVFAVDEDVDEAAQLAAFITEALLKAGIGRLKIGDDLAQAVAFAGDRILLSRQLAQRGGDFDDDAHSVFDSVLISFDNIALDWIDANALGLGPVERAVDLGRLAVQLKHDPADVLGDIRHANIGDDVELMS